MCHKSISFLDSTCKKTNSRKRSKQQCDVNSASTSEIENNKPVSKKRIQDFQGEQDELDTSIRQQNEEFHELRKQINEYLSKESQKFLLKHNDQYVPRDKDEVIEIYLKKIQ